MMTFARPTSYWLRRTNTCGCVGLAACAWSVAPTAVACCHPLEGVLDPLLSPAPAPGAREDRVPPRLDPEVAAKRRLTRVLADPNAEVPDIASGCHEPTPQT